MGEETIIQTAIQNSFSVAVAAYLLVRMDRRLKDLTDAITQLVYRLDIPRRSETPNKA